MDSGLRLIEEEDSEEEERMFRRSPIIPIVIPVAIKPKDKMATEMVNIICWNFSLSTNENSTDRFKNNAYLELKKLFTFICCDL